MKSKVKRGDRIIMQMPIYPEVFQAFQAIWRLGAITVPINFQVRQEENNFIYRDSGATAVITPPEFLDKVKIAQSTYDDLKKYYCRLRSGIPSNEIVSQSSSDLMVEDTTNENVAALIYTSGTIFLPKGVMLTPGGLAFSVRALQETTQLPQDLVSLAVLSLCHSCEVAMMNGSYLRKLGKVVIMRQINL
ncbi:MAG: long-chain fatty acid--CoA ligase [Syntrophales bacterium]|nr:long-chain fatty acid--CoA ligase [Syntrophales bacterium]